MGVNPCYHASDNGEKEDKALGRLLQEIVARSGDINGLDWVGKSSDFNSCLPASITSYEASPWKLPPLLEDEIQSSGSSLQNTVTIDFASNLYTQLRNMSASRFMAQRLHLPCITFSVKEVRRVRSPAPETHFTYRVKADGLQDLLITTEETLVQFWPARPTERKFILVRPWDLSLLELPEFAEPPEFMESSDFGHDMESEEDYGTPPSPPSHDWSGDYPVKQDAFDLESAFLLAQQRSGEYKRIASDHDIIGQIGLPLMGARVQIMRQFSSLNSGIGFSIASGVCTKTLSQGHQRRSDQPSTPLGIIGVMKDGLRCKIKRELGIWAR
ncbi:hypothetical protein EDD22DRAFT_1051159 [Suillus occidentalis]|nr:hypothetical protein EDD22DRAFT_1051159 [Suillus occidentalis]